MKVSEYVSDFTADISKCRKKVNFGTLRQVRKANIELASRYGAFHFNIVKLTLKGKSVGYGIMKGTSGKLISVNENLCLREV